jgi:membrane associated rhomboid family serine protease
MNGAQGSFWRKPSKAVLGLMVLIGCLWVMFAASINLGGSGQSIFLLLAGSSDGVLHGEIWRLLTAALMHHPQSLWGVLIAILMLYFFAPPLSERWGDKRLMMFLFGSAAFAFAFESLMWLLLPTLAADQWYGSMVMADAAIVAWALGARGEIVRFYFVIPMKPMVMVAIMVAFHVLTIIAGQRSSAGLFAPFAAMLAGWLFSDHSPLRRAWLKLKLKRLQSEVGSLEAQRRARARKAKASHLRVIPGGHDDDDKPIVH